MPLRRKGRKEGESMPVLKIKTKIKLSKAALKALTDALAQTGLSP